MVVLLVVDLVVGTRFVVVVVDSVGAAKFLKSSSISDVMISSLRGAILRPSRL